jgi:hypothetical protein
MPRIARLDTQGLLHHVMIMGIERRDRVHERDLLCYCVVDDLGIPMVDVARRFDITPAAVSISVQRGKKTAKDNKLE